MILRTSIFLLLWLSGAAHADIIFFDLNNAPQEIAAAERAARARGERVHVLPRTTAAERALATQLEQRLITAERRMLTASVEQRTDAMHEFEAVLRERERHLHGSLRFGAQRAQEALAELRAKGVKVTSIIMSGHSGNEGNFSGNNGQLHRRELQSIMRGMPEMAANVTSMVLPGCNTTRPGCLEQDWLDAFPNLRAVIGYNGTAPSHTRGAGHQLIERFLRDEAKLAAARTPDQVRRVINDIIPADVGTTASICLPGKKYGTRSGVIDMAEAWKQCEGIADTLQRHQDRVSCYLHAQPGCENPPGETQTGPLREYYVALQRMQPCLNLDGFRGQGHLVTNGESMIRLIYWKHITKNFAQQNRTALNETRAMMLAAGVPQELADKLLKVKDMTRREWMDYIGQLQEQVRHLGSREIDFNDENRAAAQVALDSVVGALDTHLTHLDQQCVPFHWVEANSNALSPCSQQLGQKAWDLGRQQLPVARLDREIGMVSNRMHEIKNADAGDQDPIVSDAAAAATIQRAQIEQFRARIQVLEAQRDIAATETEIARLGDTPAYAAHVREYREHLTSLRGRLQQSQARARDLGEPLDAEALRADPPRFFAAAARSVDIDDANSDRLMREHTATIERLRQRLNGPNPNRQRIDRELQYRQRQIEALRKAKTERQEHREYLQQMNRIFSTPGGDAEAQARVAQIVANRVRIMRETRMDGLTEELRFTQSELETCERNQSSWCSSHLTEWRDRVAELTQTLQTLQNEHVLNYY